LIKIEIKYELSQINYQFTNISILNIDYE